MASAHQCRHPEKAGRNYGDTARLWRSVTKRAGGARRPVRAERSLLFGFAFVANFAAYAQPPEPEGYRLDDFPAPAPAPVAGGVVLDAEAAPKLWQSGRAVWIDVLPAAGRPENLPASALWMPLPHRDIPGSVWLPDIGRGALSPELEAYF